MRHHHEGCCKGEGHHHGGCEHRHGRGGGGGRRQRFFGHGELRLVILDILSREASHGYELIKAIENLTQGNYTPSPGVIYPTLDFLQDQAFIAVSEEDGGVKKSLSLTPAHNGWKRIVNISATFRNASTHAMSALNCVRIRR